MKAILLCMLFLFSSDPSLGQREIGAETARLTEIYEVENALEEKEREISGTLTLDGSYDAEAALHRLWRSVLEKLHDAGKAELGFSWNLVMLAILCSLVGVLSPEQRIGKNAELVIITSSVMERHIRDALLILNSSSVVRQVATMIRVY